MAEFGIVMIFHVTAIKMQLKVNIILGVHRPQFIVINCTKETPVLLYSILDRLAGNLHNWSV
jgi:hypothetical protein